MRYRRLGHASVSEVSFGAWVLGGMYGRVDEAEARALVRKALDLGVNLFDAADVYGAGAAERALGELLEGWDVYVTTKVGYDFYGGGRPRRRYDEAYLSQALRMSVERLRRRPLAVLMHNPTAEDVRRSYKAFAGLAKAHADMAGVALGPELDVLPQGEAALEEGADVLMFVFNALEQEPGRTLISLGAGRGLMARVPHATGALADEFKESYPAEDHRSLRDPAWLRRARKIAEERIRPLAGELGLTLSQYAVKFVLSFPISTVVVTATRPEELEAYADASDGKPLPEEHLEGLAEVYEAARKSITLGGA